MLIFDFCYGIKTEVREVWGPIIIERKVGINFAVGCKVLTKMTKSKE